MGLIFGGAVAVAGTVSDSHTLDISAVVNSSTPPPSGGGSNPTATIVLSGTSFPGAKLTLLKDGAVSTILTANADGTFQITINNLSYGNYQLSVFAEDPNGETSSSYVVNVSAFSSTPFQYDGIILPPTIKASTLLAEIGQSFSVYGYSAPNSVVTLQIPGGAELGSVTAGLNGFYQINTIANLAPGVYSLRVKANLNGVTSLYSKPVQILFYKGKLPPGQPNPPPQYGVCVDYNKDNRVNLIDFSILLFWFGKNPVPPSIDCNGDKVIDIKDFSILMYFWTG